MIKDIYEARAYKADTIGFTEMGKTSMETAQSEPQTFTYEAVTSHTPTPPPTSAP